MSKRKKKYRRRMMLKIIVYIFVLVLAVMAIGKAVKSLSSFAEDVADVYYTQPYSEGEISPQEVKTALNITKDNEWNLVLVNKRNPLPEGYAVKLKKINGGHEVDARIYSDLKNMMSDARAYGLSPLICSSYRTYSKQQSLFENKVRECFAEGYSYEQGQEEAARWVAPPGTSEHHTGLAVDIVATYYQQLDEQQEHTAEQQWLMENSYKYGFILRYPSNKSEITGINFEPWHYRYVGKKAAKEIYERGICLEEYLN